MVSDGGEGTAFSVAEGCVEPCCIAGECSSGVGVRSLLGGARPRPEVVVRAFLTLFTMAEGVWAGRERSSLPHAV